MNNPTTRTLPPDDGFVYAYATNVSGRDISRFSVMEIQPFGYKGATRYIHDTQNVIANPQFRLGSEELGEELRFLPLVAVQSKIDAYQLVLPYTPYKDRGRDARQRFCVTQETIKNDETGLVMIQGLTWVEAVYGDVDPSNRLWHCWFKMAGFQGNNPPVDPLDDLEADLRASTDRRVRPIIQRITSNSPNVDYWQFPNISPPQYVYAKAGTVYYNQKTFWCPCIVMINPLPPHYSAPAFFSDVI